MADRPEGDVLDQELRCAMSDVAAVPEPAPEFYELFSPTLTLEGEQTMKTNTRYVLIAAAAAVVAIIVGVIAFGSGSEGALDTADLPDTPTTTLPDRAPATTGVDEPSAEDLIGAWSDAFGETWTISDGVIAVELGVVDALIFTASGTTIELIGDECGRDLVGTYSWAIEGDVLSLSLVDDECVDRGKDLDGFELERRELDPLKADRLYGVWSSHWSSPLAETWTISDGTIAVDDGTVPEIAYTATETTIELYQDECGRDVPGTYVWVIEGDVLTLTLVDDECSGRGVDLNGAMFERVRE